jgi:hypothetical protein
MTNETYESPGMRAKEVMSEAEKNLRDSQRQLDMDGCMVGVSRQALDETLDEFTRLRDEVSTLQNFVTTRGAMYFFKLHIDKIAALEARAEAAEADLAKVRNNADVDWSIVCDAYSDAADIDGVSPEALRGSFRAFGLVVTHINAGDASITEGK